MGLLGRRRFGLVGSKMFSACTNLPQPSLNNFEGFWRTVPKASYTNHIHNINGNNPDSQRQCQYTVHSKQIKFFWVVYVHVNSNISHYIVPTGTIANLFRQLFFNWKKSMIDNIEFCCNDYSFLNCAYFKFSFVNVRSLVYILRT